MQYPIIIAVALGLLAFQIKMTVKGIKIVTTAIVLNNFSFIIKTLLLINYEPMCQLSLL